MGGKFGTKESEEVMTLGAKLGAFAIKELKTKGAYLKEDILALLSSPAFQKAAQDAVTDITKSPDELGELDVGDYWSLSKHSVVCGLMLLDAAKS